MDKKQYISPELKPWGTVTDLTATGYTHCGDDAFNGSVTHSNAGASEMIKECSKD